MEPVIFESPTRRSTKRIGTSRTRRPSRSTRYVVSIWNPYPRADTASRSIASSVARRKHEAAREVADADAEEHLGVQAPAPRDEAPEQAPVLGATPGAYRDRARGRPPGGLDQPRDVGGVVGEVAVHLEHELGAVGQSTPEPGDVGRPDPLLGGGAPRPTRAPASRSAISPGPVGRSVVDHEHAVARGVQDVAERPHHRLEVSRSLYVGRQTTARGMSLSSPHGEGAARNAELADQLDLLADVSEILGEESFKIIAYRRAATRIRETPSPVAELRSPAVRARHRQDDRGEGARGRRAGRDPGAQATPGARARGRRGLPSPTRRGPEDSGPHLDPARRDDPGRASGRGRGGRRELSGWARGARRRSSPHSPQGGQEEAGRGPSLLGVALPEVARVVEELSAHPAAIAVSEAGSARRRRETVHDLDPIATSTDPMALIEAFCEGAWVSRSSRAVTRRRRSGRAPGAPARPPVVPPECYGNVLQHFTGSKDHNIFLREGQRRGLSISEYGVTVVESDEVVTHATEEELYEYLGYQPIPPELREGTASRAARRGVAQARGVGRPRRGAALPLDLVGGRKGSIEEMARTAKSRGLRYLCVTDHSHYLRDGRLEAQWQEIEAVHERIKPASSAGSRRTSARTARSMCRTTFSRSSTVVASCIRPSSAARPSASSPRSTTRTSTASAPHGAEA